MFPAACIRPDRSRPIRGHTSWKGRFRSLETTLGNGAVVLCRDESSATFQSSAVADKAPSNEADHPLIRLSLQGKKTAPRSVSSMLTGEN
eukprot:s1500_g9.t1